MIEPKSAELLARESALHLATPVYFVDNGVTTDTTGVIIHVVADGEEFLADGRRYTMTPESGRAYSVHWDGEAGTNEIYDANEIAPIPEADIRR